MQLTTRHATLGDLAELLKEQHARKLDLIVPASKLTSENARLRVRGAEPIITDDGVTDADGLYAPMTQCVEHLAEKLAIPVAYLKRISTDRPDLFDANVNGWLHGTTSYLGQDNPPPPASGDARSFMLRTFKGDDSDDGIARALLSDRFDIVDNLDVLMATLQGVREAGVDVDIASCDLSDRRMYVRVVCPEVSALAPTLLDRYRSPYDTGRPEGEPPETVFGGFEISNSETGGGAFTITPRIVVLICNNGLTMTRDALRRVHLGGKLDEGVIRWSGDTQKRALELVAAQTRDAVATFLDVDYVKGVIERLEADAGKPVTRPDDLVRTIGKTLRFSESAIDGVLDHFIRGGQMTTGGVLNAVTSYAQAVTNADAAHDLEAQAMQAFDLAVAAN